MQRDHRPPAGFLLVGGEGGVVGCNGEIKSAKGLKRQGMTLNQQTGSHVTYTPNRQYRDLKSSIGMFL